MYQCSFLLLVRLTMYFSTWRIPTTLLLYSYRISPKNTLVWGEWLSCQNHDVHFFHKSYSYFHQSLAKMICSGWSSPLRLSLLVGAILMASYTTFKWFSFSLYANLLLYLCILMMQISLRDIFFFPSSLNSIVVIVL